LQQQAANVLAEIDGLLKLPNSPATREQERSEQGREQRLEWRARRLKSVHWLSGPTASLLFPLVS
jgi:hypothetical protein